MASLRVLSRLGIRPTLEVPEAPNLAGGPAGSTVAVGHRSAQLRTIATQAALMWLVSRLLFAAITYFGLLLIPNAPTIQNTGPLSVMDMLSAWSRHDSAWYIRIAQTGYSSPQRTAFFPLFPALIRLVTVFIGPHWVLAGLLVSNLAALALFIGLGFLAYDEQGADGAWRTIQVTMAYPLAFFTAAVYTESLFLALAVFALFFARRGRWTYAALFAFAAACSRPTGAILVLPLLWEYGRQHGWWRRVFWQEGLWRKALTLRTVREVVVLLGAVPLAVGLFAMLIWARFGHPLLILHSHRIYWGRDSTPIWQTLWGMLQYIFTNAALSYDQALGLIDILSVFAACVLIVVMARRAPVAYTLYMIGLVYLTIATPMPAKPPGIESAGRFLLAAIPAFLLLAHWIKDQPWLQYLVINGGFALQAVLLVFYLLNGWLP